MAEYAEVRIAFDRATTRRVDQDGHLHVEMANISKANVCRYLGEDIPNWDKLGLDARREYTMFRDPEELAKGAHTFKGKPLLDEHIEAFSDNHPTHAVVGAIGNDVAFDGTYLKSSLSVWKGDSIARIESGEQKEISCGYRYVADMTPGSYSGVAYDGVMRQIVGNHVALVKKGRAGSDVVVGDSRLEMSMLKSRLALMASGAVFATVRPRLAEGAKLALDSAFDGVTRDTFAEQRQSVADAVLEIVTPLLAADQELDAKTVLVALDAAASSDDDEDDEIAGDETPPLPKKKPKAKMAGDKKPDEPVVIALDEASIRRNVMAEIMALDTAERAVLPHVGVLAERPTTKEAIYKLALDGAIADGRLDKDALTNVPPASYEHMVRALALPSAAPTPIVAMDEASNKWMDDMGLTSPARVRG